MTISNNKINNSRNSSISSNAGKVLRRRRRERKREEERGRGREEKRSEGSEGEKGGERGERKVGVTETEDDMAFENGATTVGVKTAGVANGHAEVMKSGNGKERAGWYANDGIREYYAGMWTATLHKIPSNCSFIVMTTNIVFIMKAVFECESCPRFLVVFILVKINSGIVC